MAINKLKCDEIFMVIRGAIYGNLCSKENSAMIGFYIKHEWPRISQNTMKYSWKFSKVSVVDCNVR